MLAQLTEPRRRSLVALTLFFLFLGLYLLTAGEGFNSWDGEMLFNITWNLPTRGTLAISCDSGVAGRDGRCYSSYEPAMPVASVPLVWLAQVTNRVFLHSDDLLASRVFVARFNQIITALCGVVMFYWGCRLYGETLAGVVIALVYGVATLAWPYSKFHFREPMTALGLVVGSYYLFAHRQTGVRRLLWWAGFAFAVAALTRVTAVLCFPFALLYLEFVVRQAGGGRRAAWKARAVFWTPLLVSLALVAYYNWYRFGSIVDFGYPDKAWTTFLPTGLYGLLLSPGKGMFWYSPVTTAALWGMVKLYRRRRPETLLFGAFFGSFLLFHAGFWAWGGGDCWGPRYLVPVIPFLVLALGSLFTGRIGVWVLTLCVPVSIWVQVVGVGVEFNHYIATVPDEHLRLFTWRYTPLLYHARYLLTGRGGNFLGRELWALGLPPSSPLIWRGVWIAVFALASAVLGGLVWPMRLRDMGMRIRCMAWSRISGQRGT